MFTEGDEANFKGSWYSKTKGFVDSILKDSYDNCLTLRLRMPISDDLSHRNFLTKISKYEFLVNIPNSMSVLHDLLPLMLKMAAAGKSGIYNFTNPGVISHNQCMDLYKKYIDPAKTWKNFTLEEQDKILKAGRSNNELCTKKLEACAAELGVPLPHILDSMVGVFKRMALNLKIPGAVPMGERDNVFLIVGARGWVGGKTLRLLRAQGKPVFSSKVRMQDREALAAELDRLRPTHVLNCAGRTGRPNVDWCEDNREEVIRCNVIGTLNLVDVCHQRNIHVTNLATGCIFHYDDKLPMHKWNPTTKAWENGGQFTEESKPNFDGSWYSQTKGYVDQILKDSYDNCLTLRLRMPISDDLSPRNFITKISKYEKIVNIPNSMSVLYDLIPLMIRMAEARKTGIYNFTNPGVISHNQVMDLYAKYIDPTNTYTNFTIEEQDKILKAARSNNELSTAKLEACAQELEVPLPHILESIQGVFKRMKVNLEAAGALPCKNPREG
jgi:3,5-epimerase/4-reductase